MTWSSTDWQPMSINPTRCVEMYPYSSSFHLLVCTAGIVFVIFGKLPFSHSSYTMINHSI